MAGLVNIVSWQAPKKNHDELVKLMAGGIDRTSGIDAQRFMAKEIMYSKTRTFFKTNDENPEIEDWFFMDEYDDSSLFVKQIKVWKNSKKITEDAKEVHDKMNSLVVPGTFIVAKQTQYTEAEPLTIEFEPYARRAASLVRDDDPAWHVLK